MFDLTIILCTLVIGSTEPSCGNFKGSYPTIRSCAEAMTRGLHDNAAYAGESDKLIIGIFGMCEPASPEVSKPDPLLGDEI